MKNKIEILKTFGEIAKKLKESPPSKEFWKRHNDLMKRIDKQQELERKSIEMSPEKYHQQFTL